MEQLYYNTYTTDGIFIGEDIKTDLSALRALIVNLESYNKLLAGMNETGVIISDMKSSVAEVESLEIKIDEKLFYIKNDISFINNRFIAIESKHLNLKNDIDNIIFNYSNDNNDEKMKEVTGEFFLLIDSLPEKIKKELKIYIKKDDI